MTLATARALEGIAATHKQNALDLVAIRGGSSEEGVRHYIRTMDLPAHQAQMVYQQALAAMAEEELAEEPDAIRRDGSGRGGADADADSVPEGVGEGELARRRGRGQRGSGAVSFAVP